MDKVTRIQSCRTAVADYEKNLENFASGKVKPGIGEVQANKRALRLRREELQRLEAKEVEAKAQ